MINTQTTGIQKIVDYFKKLEKAKTRVLDYTNGINETNLNDQIKSIESTISDKILKFLIKIEALISANDFYEAEENRENINNIRQLLGKYCFSEEINKKVDKFQESLEQIIDQASLKYIEQPLTDYIQYPPKEIIEKLNNKIK